MQPPSDLVLDHAALNQHRDKRVYDELMKLQKEGDAIKLANRKTQEWEAKVKKKPKLRPKEEEERSPTPPRLCPECNKRVWDFLFLGTCDACGLWQSFSQASLIV